MWLMMFNEAGELSWKQKLVMRVYVRDEGVNPNRTYLIQWVSAGHTKGLVN